MLMLAFLVLIALPFVHMARGTLPDYHPFAVAMPALSLFSLNVFGKMAMGALSGFEYVAVLAGETKDAARTIGRATMIAAPIIAAMFILGTSAVLAFVPVDQINLIGPIPQVFRIGLRRDRAREPCGGRSRSCSSRAARSRTRASRSPGRRACRWSPAGTICCRAWFTKLHPRYRTPINSILFVGLVALAFGAVGIAGVGEQEAFQLLENAAGIFYGLTYLVHVRDSARSGCAASSRGRRCGLRVAAASGFARHAAVCRAVDLSDHRRRELVQLRGEDLGRGDLLEPCWRWTVRHGASSSRARGGGVKRSGVVRYLAFTAILLADAGTLARAQQLHSRRGTVRSDRGGRAR